MIACHCFDEEPCASKIEIFRHLDKESLLKISNLALHNTYAKNDILFTPSKNEGLFLIRKGKVKVYEISPSGKEMLLRVLKEGDFVGEEALFSSKETYTFGKALTDLETCFIKRDDFIDLLMKYPSISLKLLEQYNQRLIHSNHQATSNTVESVLVRLINYLMELSDEQESDIVSLPIPMKELSTFLGTTPETLSRRIRYLEEHGYIHKGNKKITLFKNKLKNDLLDK
ncbi:MAG: Crp/Fnr family transcriptional regulator [Holdemanella sp.]|nr:Crp/Fnr family transcriptional regulator [Holdemanella sp.]